MFWHFARGMALAGKGKPDEAQADYEVVAGAEKNTPEDVVFAMPVNNKTKDVLKIARDVLGAKIALAKKDSAARHRAAAERGGGAGFAEVQRAGRLVLPGARVAGRGAADERRCCRARRKSSATTWSVIRAIRVRCSDWSRP